MLKSRFQFLRSRVGRRILYFFLTPRWHCCCWSTDHTLSLQDPGVKKGALRIGWLCTSGWDRTPQPNHTCYTGIIRWSVAGRPLNKNTDNAALRASGGLTNHMLWCSVFLPHPLTKTSGVLMAWKHNSNSFPWFMRPLLACLCGPLWLWLWSCHLIHCGTVTMIAFQFQKFLKFLI